MPQKFRTFREYLNNNHYSVTIGYTDTQPPTKEDLDLFESVKKVASGETYRIYIPQTVKSKRILEYTNKVKYARKLFPSHARSIILDENIDSLTTVLDKLYDQGYNSVNIVAESDRSCEFNTIANKYNGVERSNGFYHFENGVNVISTGNTSQVSENTKVRESEKLIHNAEHNDFQAFVKGLPENFSEAKQLFNDIRVGLGLLKSHDLRTQVQLAPVSEDRERYVHGNLFSKGDEVIINESDEVGTISYLGANYVIVRTNENKQYRKWLSDISLLDEGVNVDRVEKEYDEKRQELEKEYQEDLADAEERDERAEDQRDDKEDGEQEQQTNENQMVRINRILHSSSNN